MYGQLLSFDLFVLSTLHVEFDSSSFLNSEPLLSFKIVFSCFLEHLTFAVRTIKLTPNMLLDLVLPSSKLIRLVRWSLEKFGDQVFIRFLEFCTLPYSLISLFKLAILLCYFDQFQLFDHFLLSFPVQSLYSGLFDLTSFLGISIFSQSAMSVAHLLSQLNLRPYVNTLPKVS